MAILVGCEFSGRIRDALMRAGYDAWSCDLLPSESDFGPHLQCDVRDVLDWGWTGAIFHPPCTYLTNSALNVIFHPELYPNSLTGEKRIDAMEEALCFWIALREASIPHIAIENPIPHHFARMVTGYYDQLTQPYMFGDCESKATCWWLQGLPKLKPTNIVISRRGKAWKESPGNDRWKKRSMIPNGMIDAIVSQWGDILDSKSMGMVR